VLKLSEFFTHKIIYLINNKAKIKLLRRIFIKYIKYWVVTRDFYSNRITKKMFEVEHLIYNQWCSQYKSDKTL
jgi:hypothetical protein